MLMAIKCNAKPHYQAISELHGNALENTHKI